MQEDTVVDFVGSFVLAVVVNEVAVRVDKVHDDVVVNKVAVRVDKVHDDAVVDLKRTESAVFWPTFIKLQTN